MTNHPVLFTRLAEQNALNYLWSAGPAGREVLVGPRGIKMGSDLYVGLSGSRRWDDFSAVGKSAERIGTHDIYKGIDMVLSACGSEVSMQFTVTPNGDASQIRLAYDGAQNLRIEKKTGDLLFTTADGSEMRQVRPVAYQYIGVLRTPVFARYEIVGPGRAALVLNAYDHYFPLIVTPSIRRQHVTQPTAAMEHHG